MSPTEWVFSCGQIGDRKAEDCCYKLDIKAGQLTKLDKLGEAKLAHQVIYLPPTESEPKGAIYAFGGKTTLSAFSMTSWKFDLAEETWT